MLKIDEVYDLEKMNFLPWYRDATVEDIAAAMRNNAARLDELEKKYAADIELMDICGIHRKDAKDGRGERPFALPHHNEQRS